MYCRDVNENIQGVDSCCPVLPVHYPILDSGRWEGKKVTGLGFPVFESFFLVSSPHLDPVAG